jgi:hypothetical protein
MTEISDSYMREQLATTQNYTLVLLTASDKYGAEGTEPVIWEHGRRNFQLRADGKLSIVAPVRDDSPLCGIGIFTTPVEETTSIMADDPAVRAGIFTFEVHPISGFPGSSL